MTTDDLFPPPSTADVTVERKIDALEREIRLREKVYPRWVASGRLEEQEAARRLLVLQAILEDYRDERVRELILGRR